MGIKSGIFLRGHIRVNRYNPSHDAFVDCGGTGTASAGCRLITLKGVPVTFGDDQMRLSRVFVAGQQHRNRAVEGDEVAVQLLPQHEWSSPSNRLGATGLGQEATNATVPTGRIVGIIARNWRSYVATIRVSQCWASCLSCNPLTCSLKTWNGCSAEGAEITSCVFPWTPESPKFE